MVFVSRNIGGAERASVTEPVAVEAQPRRV